MNRIDKSRHKKTEQSTSLWLIALSRCVEMPMCSFCKSCKARCLASEEDSSRCTECIKHKRGNCNMHGLSPLQVEKIVAQHSAAETALDDAEEELERATAKVRWLRKQRKLWAEKIARAVRCGLDTIEKLDCVEAEELAKEQQARVPAGPLPERFSALVSGELF
ncbi:hypothetical protein M406DRAFT_262286 [Cryphonectria parasitica EP155]|uniref:Uncharacterized protein n=1 Tax=Cryphonectria parasitica (strain ATCC 38755 / EP155) TaxID=660469 RepID=A0A9P4Y0S5_CRYP1|nr:uncharacterized protein M406DRAFT_262286 [Cryphonectria parasitica EP155]KAF3764040.1 hypothetical protein M406DRAFT_262286 [Cryphonectria parasitica EP155]